MAVIHTKYGPDPLHNVAVTAAPAGKVYPSVIWVHGGGWTSGDNTKIGTAKKAAKCAALGFAVFNIDYPLATRERRGAGMQPEAVRLAIRWVRANAARYGGSPTDVNLIGGSAGAHLVSLISMSEPVSRVVEVSGPMDLTVITDVPVGTYKAIEVYMGGTRDTLTLQELKDQSPRWMVNPGTPPHLVVNSSRELIPVDQAYDMTDALKAAGIRNKLVIVPGGEHSMSLWDDIDTEYVAAFLRS